MSKFLTGSLMRAFNPVKPECFLLLPVLCANESSELEPNLSRDCLVTLACLSQSLLPPSSLEACLKAIDGVARGAASWKAKCAALDMLNVRDCCFLCASFMFTVACFSLRSVSSTTSPWFSPDLSGWRW